MIHSFIILLIVSNCQSQLVFPPRPSSNSANTNSPNPPAPSSVGSICGRNAECTPITRCPELLSKTLVNNVANSLEVRQAVCIIRNGVIHVCCRNPSRPIPVPTRLSGESLLPKDSDCGKPTTDDRIVGGEIAPINAYPWMVAMRLRDPFGIEDFECAASVINSRYLLTAAHCADASSNGKEIIQLNIGDYDTSNPNIDCRRHNLGQVCSQRPHIAAKPEEIIIHPNYSKRFTESDDIALIRIDREIDFNADRNHITPVCLPKEEFNIRSLKTDESPIAAGWGFTENKTASNILLHVRISFADRDLCARLYRELFADKQICAGGEAGKDTCPGDSGGPLVISTRSGPPYTQIGIVSLGPSNCGLDNFPAVYTDVAKYRQWILDNLKP